MKRYALNLVGLLSLALAVAFLAPQRALADDDDPPGRVARLGYIQGNVSFEPAGTEDWVAAVVNRPLTTGDKLWNDNDSLSELHLGSAVIRLGGNTGFSFLNLTDNMAQIQLTEGTLNIRVRRLADDETFEVDTPNLAFTLLRPGSYKVNVNEAGDATVVLVREGQGEVTGGGSAYTVHPREVATFTGTDQIDGNVQGWNNSSDDFDNWCSEREDRMAHSVSARYVSDDVIGYEDLDDYGRWRQVPQYGNVWFPQETAAGWAPYHTGHWVYIAPWGYTWVDDAPWGFAPFHYGRWVVVGGFWGWVPAPPRTVVVGAVYVRPVYAPALVAWVGGAHFGVGVNVGWFPLGPREVYVPSYHVSRTYVNNINVSNTTVNTTVVNNYYNTTVVNRTNVTNVTYVNQRERGAVMVTTSAAFTSAQSVSRHAVVVNEREVAAARVSYGAPAVAPSRQAVLGAGAAVRYRPPVVVENRVVVVKQAPPPAAPSFARQQEAIRANGGRPLAVSQMRQIQPERTEVRNNVRVAPVATPRNMQADRDAQPNRGFRPNNDRTGQSDAERGGQHNPNRPVNPGNAVNNSGNPPVTNTHERIYTDRPTNNRPSTPANTSNAPVGNPQADANRDVPRNSGRPVNPGNAVNNSGNPPSTGTHQRVYTDRPSNTAPVAPANSPNAPVVNPQADANRDVQRNSGRPVNPGNAANNSGNPPSTGTHERVYTDRPSNTAPVAPASRPNAPVVNPQVEPRNQQPPQNLRADRPGAIRQDTPPSNSNNPNNVTPRVEPKPQPAPQNVHPPQNQERARPEQPKPQPKQQEEKKKDQKPAKPAKEDKPSKSSK
ncbi:MAG TPA: DUF6600 domain-containing protein [Candidatus Acidoferrum sp.]|nr:DUF6600 domain-containing protein [Candidatus Acidoferrum sp.]